MAGGGYRAQAASSEQEETAGHGVGTMCFRWIGAREIVDPETLVERLS